MKLQSILPFLYTLFATSGAVGQGTFLFDQQSSTNEAPVPGVPGSGFQQLSPFGQSFTPGFSGIGFIRLNLSDSNPGNSLGATLYVNLRANSIAGAILGTTTPVLLPDNFGGPVNFFFPTDIPLISGTRYYLEPVVQSGDLWTSATSGDRVYPGGTLYISGSPVPGSSLWFREGLYVIPEPSGMALAALTAVALRFARRKHIRPARNAA